MEIFVLLVAIVAAFLAGKLWGSKGRAALLARYENLEGVRIALTAQNELLTRDLARLTDRDERGRFVKRER